MALKLGAAVAALRVLVQPSALKTDPYLAGITAKTPCPDGHTWNPQSGTCVRCGVVRQGMDNPQADAVQAAYKTLKPGQGTPPPNLRIKGLQDVPTAPQVVLSASSQALRAKEPKPFKPLVLGEGETYTILHALLEHSMGHPGTLMLVKNKSGEGLKVEELLEANLQKASLLLSGNNGMKFKTTVGDREVPQYTPVWR